MTSPAVRPHKFSILLAVLILTAVIPLSGQTLRFADGLTYNDFYAVTVHMADGESFTLFDTASFSGDSSPWPNAEGSFSDQPASAPEGMSYFFWVRRAGASGAVTYPLSFDKISEIRFIGPYSGIDAEPRQEASLAIVGVEVQDAVVRVNGRRFSGWFFPQELEPPVPSYTPVVLKTAGTETERTVYLKTDGFLGGIDEDFGTYGLMWLREAGIERLEFHHDGTFNRCPLCGSIFFDDRHETCPFDGTKLSDQQ